MSPTYITNLLLKENNTKGVIFVSSDLYEWLYSKLSVDLKYLAKSIKTNKEFIFYNESTLKIIKYDNPEKFRGLSVNYVQLYAPTFNNELQHLLSSVIYPGLRINDGIVFL